MNKKILIEISIPSGEHDSISIINPDNPPKLSKKNIEEWDIHYKYSDGPPTDIPEITEPPCKNCTFFKPTTEAEIIKGKWMNNGIKICHAEDMEYDFSCFIKKNPLPK